MHYQTQIHVSSSLKYLLIRVLWLDNKRKNVSKVLTLSSVKGKIALLSIAIVISALPFLNQPMHIDDPLFLQTARNVIHNPLDPYGSVTNWLGKPDKLFDIFSLAKVRRACICIRAASCFLARIFHHVTYAYAGCGHVRICNLWSIILRSRV
jgi:hypothetical protein